MPEEAERVPYEKLYAQLEKIVNELERGEVGLEASLKQFETGISLYRECHNRLKEAERKLEKIVGESEDGVILERSDLDEEDDVDDGDDEDDLEENEDQ